MSDGWVVLKKSYRTPTAPRSVIYYPSDGCGWLSISSKAWEAIGTAEYVRLVVDQKKGLLGIVPAQFGEKHARPTRQAGRRTKRRSLACATLSDALPVARHRPTDFSVKVANGMLVCTPLAATPTNDMLLDTSCSVE